MAHREEKKHGGQGAIKKFEIVLKADSVGSAEAAVEALSRVNIPDVDLMVMRFGIGSVNKSDVLLAETGSRLIVGFEVGVLAGLEKTLREHNVEVRLYDIIYTLVFDITEVARGLIPPAAQEEITGSAKVIALFKGNRGGMIIGCEVVEGGLSVGEHFRVISAMGPVYSGTVESIHIREKAVQRAAQGQKAGIKIKDFSKAKIGDLVESFRPLPQRIKSWQPTGKIIRK
jgi:translation initiation factor IF-2